MLYDHGPAPTRDVHRASAENAMPEMLECENLKYDA